MKSVVEPVVEEEKVKTKAPSRKRIPARSDDTEEASSSALLRAEDAVLPVEPQSGGRVPKKGARSDKRKRAQDAPSGDNLDSDGVDAAQAGKQHHEKAEEDGKDEYGKGEPFDRLQFGYSPAIAAEAVAFHQQHPASQWVADRSQRWRSLFVQRHRLSASEFNCEPISSLFKLKAHWRAQSTFQMASGANTNIDMHEAEEFLASLTNTTAV